MKSFLRSLFVSLIWLGALRKYRHDQPRVITITGSVGKTSTKEAVALVLEAGSKPVFKTSGGLNTEVGVPLSLLGVYETPRSLGALIALLVKVLFPPRLRKKGYYVLEYSADKPGDISYLTKKIPGDIRVITRIVPSHMHSYATFTDLVNEKLQLMKDIRPENSIVLNYDDPELRKAGKDLPNVLWYGLSPRTSRAGVWGKDIIRTDQGIQFSVEFKLAQGMSDIGRASSASITVQSRLIGEHQLYSLLIAAAIGMKEGIKPAIIKDQLESYMLPAGRGRLIEGRKEITIIDDSYNSSPESVKSGLQMLRPFARTRRTVAVLGNMNELGPLTEEAHREVARVASKTVDYLIVIGPEGDSMRAAAEESGMKAESVIAFRSTEQLIHSIDQVFKKRDVVYVKGSQNNVRLERLVKKMMAHPKQAPELLIRQSAYWKQIK